MTTGEALEHNTENLTQKFNLNDCQKLVLRSDGKMLADIAQLDTTDNYSNFSRPQTIFRSPWNLITYYCLLQREQGGGHWQNSRHVLWDNSNNTDGLSDAGTNLEKMLVFLCTILKKYFKSLMGSVIKRKRIYVEEWNDKLSAYWFTNQKTRLYLWQYFSLS